VYSRLPLFAVSISLLAAASVVVMHPTPPDVHAATGAAPAYTSSGDLLPLTNYREWTYLSTGIDMSYTQKSEAMDHSVFDNVFVNPGAYQSFLKTGTWPDKTVMVLEVREARNRGSINLRGHFQSTGVMDIEVHVKDEARFPGKWAFFAFDSAKGNGTLIPQAAPCYTCHTAHGAVDTTFVQFYPTLLPIAHDKGTLSPAFLKEASAEVK
jgi:hypothetical protein